MAYTYMILWGRDQATYASKAQTLRKTVKVCFNGTYSLRPRETNLLYYVNNDI